MNSSVYWAQQADPALAEACERARRSFRFFWRELSWERRRIIPALDMAAVKLPFASADGSFEHMWINDVGFDGQNLSGRLINQPQAIAGLNPGDSVSAPLEQLDDWMYLSQGVLCGGFSVQAMRAQMSAAERRQHDAAWGLPFPDPALCNITPYAAPAPTPPGLLGRLLRKAPSVPGLDFEAAFQHACAHEHPMSENMRDSIAQALQQHPESIDALDEKGWSLLHHDALAGNLAPVEILLASGADPKRLTPDGDTALSLARRMDWPRIVAVLERA